MSTTDDDLAHPARATRRSCARSHLARPGLRAPGPAPAAAPSRPGRSRPCSAGSPAAAHPPRAAAWCCSCSPRCCSPPSPSAARPARRPPRRRPPAAQLEQTTVLPGDTLWAVARRLAPEHDPREVVDQIRELNDLTSTELQAGQQLLLPAAR